ncbi:hypothetical protein RJ639_044181 [Escallonia herrerae]|uniref:Receptor ligand binding region domain-containing protein n=1 Tax=Escallonia herrerae TaxID=1293975 RepID=A0AA88WDL1_9ASTE|nr:hypothetical protein RJ639_044181 [Escallonia herrerae]
MFEFLRNLSSICSSFFHGKQYCRCYERMNRSLVFIRIADYIFFNHPQNLWKKFNDLGLIFNTAQDLLKNVKVQAIIGPVTSMQANFVNNLGEHSQVPIISFSATSPSLSSLRMAAVDAWKHSDFLCKNYILNGLDNALYNVYSPMVNAKALWESLERKYKTEDAGSKKFVVGKFLDFKMVDSKTVISQVQEFQLILHDIHADGRVLGESFQVAALIEKLAPTWKDFKNYLKNKRKEMKLEDLIVRLMIEEDNRQSEKKAGNYHQEAKANVVQQAIARHIGS